MRHHRGMRPHDIVVLLKISCWQDKEWLNKDLASALYISTSEISDSLERSRIGGLIDPMKRKLFNRSFLDFLWYGMRHVFPAVPGSLTLGVPTAHSAPVFNNYFGSDEPYVWADMDGSVRGQAIEPFYAGQAMAAKADPELYDLLALCDTLRIGRVREIDAARQILSQRLKKLHVKGK